MIKVAKNGVGLAALALGVLTPALAQPLSPTATSPSSAATAGTGGAAQLSENLKILARDPYNVDAILQAGSGALAIGDTNAAFGFFARAEELAPSNWKAKAGLGSSLTLMEKPTEGLRALEEAVALGAPEKEIVADRGLAYDLIGDGRRAQRDYLSALNLRPSDEVTRRLALSLAIHGDRDAGLARLDPLLRRNDQAAWRARAFILAMSGDMPGSERIVRQVLPANMVNYMTNFMQKLASLGPAAKARAVNFGTLPVSGPSSQIAVTPDSFKPVDPTMAAQLAVQDHTARPAAPTPGFTTDTSGRETHRKSREARDQDVLAARGKLASAPAVPKTQTPVQTAMVSPVPTRQPVFVSAPPPSPLPSPSPSPSPAPSPSAPALDTAAQPSALFEVPALPQRSPAQSVPVRTSPVSVSPPAQTAASANAVATSLNPTRPVPAKTIPTGTSRLGLGEILRTLDLERESAPVALPNEAKVKAMRLAAQKKAAAEEKAKAERAEKARLAAEEKAKARRHPSRVWVQIATGSNKSGLSSTWRGLKSKAEAGLGSRKSWYTPYGQSYRVLVGPFKSADDARAVVKSLGKDGVKALTFTSDAGQEIMRIDN